MWQQVSVCILIASYTALVIRYSAYAHDIVCIMCLLSCLYAHTHSTSYCILITINGLYWQPYLLMWLFLHPLILHCVTCTPCSGHWWWAPANTCWPQGCHGAMQSTRGSTGGAEQWADHTRQSSQVGHQCMLVSLLRLIHNSPLHVWSHWIVLASDCSSIMCLHSPRPTIRRDVPHWSVVVGTNLL